MEDFQFTALSRAQFSDYRTVYDPENKVPPSQEVILIFFLHIYLPRWPTRSGKPLPAVWMEVGPWPAMDLERVLENLHPGAKFFVSWEDSETVRTTEKQFYNLYWRPRFAAFNKQLRRSNLWTPDDNLKEKDHAKD